MNGNKKETDLEDPEGSMPDKIKGLAYLKRRNKAASRGILRTS